jgi:hypothetical protein
MNRNQRIVLLSALGLVLFVGLYPPWLFVLELGGIHDSKQAGYSFLLSPPQIPPDVPSSDGIFKYDGVFHVEDGSIQVRMDFERLEVEWITLVIATVFLLLLFKRKA